VRGAQKHKKDSQVISLFTLLGLTCAKAARKHVGEIDPWCQFHQHSLSSFCTWDRFHQHLFPPHLLKKDEKYFDTGKWC